MPRVRIESDGTANGTRLVDADSGEVFRQARRVQWRVGHEEGEQLAEAVVTFAAVPVIVEVHARWEPDAAMLKRCVEAAREAQLEWPIGGPESLEPLVRAVLAAAFASTS
jgi:hypothetical protein